jgi:hypothetical protein
MKVINNERGCPRGKKLKKTLRKLAGNGNSRYSK